MSDPSDMDLVREFARSNSEPAFAELVRRHLRLVYSVALRFAGNAPDAEDVAQAVFVILARKAAGLRAQTILAGWLYETTRFTALQWLRNQTRRRVREQEAHMQSRLIETALSRQNEMEADVWRQMGPLLEAAMSRLNEKERTLIALRFFENQSGAKAAALAGISEWAAHKRIERALEKLQKYFLKRGVNSTTATLAETISANSMQAVPVALARTVTAVAVAKGAAASTSTLTLIKGALKIMAWSKAKTLIVVGVAVILAGSSSIIAVNTVRSLSPDKKKLMPLVDNFFHHNFRDVTSRQTLEWGEATRTADGNISIRYKYRANIWNRDVVTNDQIFTFNRRGKFVSVIDARYVNLPPIDPLAVRTYAVGKKVSDFPATDDLSTPEAAYAVFNRAIASGDETIWHRLSIQSIARLIPANAKPGKVSAGVAERYLNAEIFEVDVYRDAFAMAFARLDDGSIDLRHLEFEGDGG